jgi:HK97 family phage major capsid protein
MKFLQILEDNRKAAAQGRVVMMDSDEGQEIIEHGRKLFSNSTIHLPILKSKIDARAIDSSSGGFSSSAIGAYSGPVVSEPLIKLGATYTNGIESENILIPHIAVNEPGIKGETEAITETSSTVGGKVLSPYRAPVRLDVSFTFQHQALSDPLSDEAFIKECERAVRQTMYNYALNGTGTNQPLGILNNPAVTSVDKEGAAIDLDDLLTAEESVLSAVESADTFGVLTSTKGKQKLRSTIFDTGSGQTLWGVNENTVLGYPGEVSKHISISGDQTSLIFGAWQDLHLLEWGLYDVLIDRFSLKSAGTARYFVTGFVNSTVVNPTSFYVIKNFGF